MDAYKSEIKPTWCPGCGDFAVLRALQMSIHALQLEPWNILIVSGIGCSSNLPHFLSTYGFHAIHGRALPVAEGAKLANPDLQVIVTGGDGDGYGMGVERFIHAMRRNFDITYLVMNNQIYGLTTGQASPTSEKGMKTKSTPIEGVIENPIDPISLALASGATYVARTFSGDVKTMAELVKGGIEHKGFALIDCLSPCTCGQACEASWTGLSVTLTRSSCHSPWGFGSSSVVWVWAAWSPRGSSRTSRSRSREPSGGGFLFMSQWNSFGRWSSLAGSE